MKAAKQSQVIKAQTVADTALETASKELLADLSQSSQSVRVPELYLSSIALSREVVIQLEKLETLLELLGTEPTPSSYPVYKRLPKSGQQCKLSGLSRSALNELILPCAANGFKPPVKSVVLKNNKSPLLLDRTRSQE